MNTLCIIRSSTLCVRHQQSPFKYPAHPTGARLHKILVSAGVPRGRRFLGHNVSLRFCEICGNGTGLVPCPVCQGAGEVTTQPGGAGRPFYVGQARCKQCNGIGEVACPMCAGWERSMSDARISKSPDTAGHADTASMEPPDLTWLDDL